MKRDKANPPYPKGVWFQKKRLSTGEVVRYGYYGRPPGMEGLGREGTPEFFARLAEVLRKEPVAGTLDQLIWAYKQKALPKLRERTQADYRSRLDKIADQFGKLSLRAMASDAIVPHVIRWRNGMASSPRQADYMVQVLSAVLSWGERPEQRLISRNPIKGIERLYAVDRSEIIWSQDQVDGLLRHAPEPIGRALVLAIETGISQGDLLKLPWSAVKADIIVLPRRGKTGVVCAIPISKELRMGLDTWPRGDATTILTKDDGRPWGTKGNGFRAAWRAACDAAGVTGVTFNDLRGTFMSRRRAMGWSAEEVALCSGHPIAGERGAQKSYAARTFIAEANARRLWLNYYGPKTEQNLQTALQTSGGAQ